MKTNGAARIDVRRGEPRLPRGKLILAALAAAAGKEGWPAAGFRVATSKALWAVARQDRLQSPAEGALRRTRMVA